MASVSVGDCIAITEVLIKTIRALRDTGGAATEYQEAEKYAESFSRCLQNLRRLEQDPNQSTPIELEEILQLGEDSLAALLRKKAKYESTLSKGGRRNVLRSSLKKIQWALSTSKDMKDLQSTLTSESTMAVLVLQAQLL